MHAAQAMARSREASADQAEDAEVADSWKKLKVCGRWRDCAPTRLLY